MATRPLQPRAARLHQVHSIQTGRSSHGAESRTLSVTVRIPGSANRLCTDSDPVTSFPQQGLGAVGGSVRSWNCLILATKSKTET